MYGDVSNLPTLHLGRKFASPKKPESVRAKRALKRHMTTLIESTSKRSKSQHFSGSSSCPVTPAVSDSCDEDKMSEEPLSVSIGEQLFSVHELPEESTSEGSHLNLSARIDALEAETRQLKAPQASQKAIPWRISSIASNDELIRFYTGFVSYEFPGGKVRENTLNRAVFRRYSASISPCFLACFRYLSSRYRRFTPTDRRKTARKVSKLLLALSRCE